MAYFIEESLVRPNQNAETNDTAKSTRTGRVIISAINTTLGLASGVMLGLFLLTYCATEAVAMVLANLF